jgi:hypothetical protein
MKKLTQIFLVALFLPGIWACEKKSCSKVVCASYQVCNNGDCLCPNGYEGDTCSILSSTKFKGDWLVSETCTDGCYPNFTGYATNLNPVAITSVNYAVNELYFNNFFNLGYQVYAEIQNTSPTSEGVAIYIPPQNFGQVSIGASQGTFYPATVVGAQPTISIYLTYTYQGNTNNYIETLYKQP